MTEDEIYETGEWCIALLSDPKFKTLVQHYEAERVKEMLSTKPHEYKAREGIYAQVQGLTTFMSFVGQIAAEYDKLVNPAPVEDIPDNPNVHDIFRPEGVD